MIIAKERFLLYIDFLNFSNMVEHNESKVRELFEIIENLNVHHHEAFRTIVFSDTILVYNIDYAINEQDKQYYVMFLIEFVQDLFYRIANKNFFFRAFIVKDEFIFNQTKYFQQYYGKALIKAHNSEKNFPYIGLFIDKKSNIYNKVFPTKKINNKYSFVFINQELINYCNDFNEFPIKKNIINNIIGFENIINIAFDIIYLKELNNTIKYNNDNKVKLKAQNTLEFYKRRFTKFYNSCIKFDFNISILLETNIRNLNKYLNLDSKGFGKDKKDIKELKAVLWQAYIKGKNAATKELQKNSNNICGFVNLMINIDGRCKLFKQLKNCEKDKSLKFNISKFPDGYSLSFCDLHNSQYLSVNRATYIAIKKYLEKKINLSFFLTEIID